MIEEWRDVPNYEGLYQVSNLGNVKSLSRTDKRGTKRKEKLMKTPLNVQGYKSLNLYGDGIRVNVKVHQLVASAFLGYIRDGFTTNIVDHIDNDKTNNRLDNLQLVTPRFNASKDVMNKTSKYTGVCYISNRKKWQSQIKHEGRTIFLGYYDCEENAKDAYNTKLEEILCLR
jgi:hypothetical protein